MDLSVTKVFASQVTPNQQCCNCVYLVGRFLVAKCRIFHVIPERTHIQFIC